MFHLQEHASQLLVQALVLSRLDYCNAFLAGPPSQFHQTSTINPERSSKIHLTEPKRTHVTPLFICLHWLPIAARIKFKALMFPYKTTTGSAPNSLLQIMCPLEVYILQVNVALLCHPKQAQKHFHWLLNEKFSPGEMICLTQPEQRSPYPSSRNG